MDNTNEKESHILPQPERSSRAPAAQEGGPGPASVQPEHGSVHSAEKAELPPASSPQAVAPVNDDAVTDNSSSASGATAVSATSVLPDTPMIADDNDLIEKEWVSKAKQIVDQTKDDPYNQNKQIVRLRADYLKKRYNKDVKIQED